MADQVIQVPADSVGKKVDTTELTVSAATVQRQRVQLAGNAAADICPVDATAGVKVNLGADNDVSIAANSSVNVAQVAATATSVNAGNVDAGTQRVVLATDQAVVSVDDNAGALTVDAANDSSLTTRIGDGTNVVAIPTDGLGADTTGIHAMGTDGTNAQIISTNVTGHVNIADGGNVISVDDAAGTLTVDAPIATPVNVQLSDGTDTAAITANGGLNVNLRINAGTEAGIPSAPLATRPSNSTTFLTPFDLDLDTGGGQIDRYSVGLAGAAVGGPVPIPGDATAGLKVDLGADNDVSAPVGTPVFVQQSDGTASIDPRDSNDTTKTLKTASINVASSGENTIIALVASKRLKVYNIVLNSTGTVNVKWKDGAGGTDLTGDMNFEAREGFTTAVTPPGWVLATSSGNALILNLSAAIAVDGWVSYWDDDAS